jgi:hypothetical protein
MRTQGAGKCELYPAGIRSFLINSCFRTFHRLLVLSILSYAKDKSRKRFLASVVGFYLPVRRKGTVWAKTFTSRLLGMAVWKQSLYCCLSQIRIMLVPTCGNSTFELRSSSFDIRPWRVSARAGCTALASRASSRLLLYVELGFATGACGELPY